MRLRLFKKGKKNNKYPLFKYALFLIISFLAIIFLYGNLSVNKIYAQEFFVLPSDIGGYSADEFMSIKTSDKGTQSGIFTQTMKDIANWAKEFATWATKWNKDSLAAIAFKTGVGNFFNRLAYDTATYLATGDKGQAPMFQTDNLGDFVSNAADYAAGDFLEALGRSNDWGEFNLCNPSLAVKARINIGMFNTRRPKEPACTFSKMLDNWDAELSDPNFLNNFQDMFNPWSNDFGIALTLQSGMGQKVDEVANNALNTWMKDTFKPVTSKISGKIKTPGALVGEAAKKAYNDSTSKEQTFTGDIMADAIGTFINTLISKLMQSWFHKGLVNHFPDNSYDWDKLSGLYDYNAGSSKSGINSAKERFRTLVEPQFNERGNYDILDELVSCPDPSKAGPTNCVITDNFRQAITNKMTVGEAMRQGYLNPEGVFGFTSGSDTDNPPEPAYYEGYPYRSMIILRKFRILPVGWELAAEYIKDTLGDTRNLEDLVNCYSKDDNYGEGDEDWATWCEGLVDPNWVLKAPLNYCRREGPGPEIMSEEVSGQGDDSKLNISRNDNYCADEQTCIVEGSDDSCDYYGYCTEERREWDFNADSCDPKYNTCETFRGRDGQTVSYLQDTLDYSGCTADNVGCLGYCEDYNYTASTFSCTSTGGNKVYLDSGVEACNQSEEGCHEFIRTKAGLGANLLYNSSFEDDTDLWPELTGTLVEDDAYHGNNSYDLSADFSKVIEAGPAGNSLEAKSLTLSLYAKNCNDGDAIYLENTNIASTSIMSGSDWQFYQVTYLYPLGFGGNQVTFGASTTGASCQIDAVKLEFGSSATAYSDYRGNGLTYLKLAPNYLSCDGTDDPAECDDYVRYCSAYDEGCNMFTSLTDGMSVPAKVIGSDYCPAECVGYDEYLQTETYFDDPGTADFIPKMAKKCSAQSVGCDEFTNLDKLGEGAEAREYYRELKQCQKPDASCADFYSWEGSAETGYQLKTYSLQDDGLGAPSLTNTGMYNGMTCSSSTYDTVYNPMCREFYNKSGEVFYRFYPYVVTCSDNCHPYRRTENNVMESGFQAQGACTAEQGGDPTGCAPIDCETENGGKVCEFDDGTAVFCKNGGVWNYQHEACIYNAIPGEGLKCSAAQAGCREYSGNAGANMRVLFTDTFESGTTDNWEGDLAADNPSNESLIVGQHSLNANGTTIYKTVGNLVNIDKNYVLSFLAKSSAANSFAEIGFGSSTVTGVSIPFALGTANLSSEWHQYKFNLPNLNNASGDYEVSPTEKIFIITNNSNFYVDNIRLTEISDRYYLIKNNWNLPEACLHDINGNSVPADYNLGCDAYRDQNNETYYLKSFSHLCSDSAVGCETMIDTHNYSKYHGHIFNLTLPPDAAQKTVATDTYAYVVYDRDKRCNAGDKGCQFLGKPHTYEDDVVYSGLYYKNDPDKYEDSSGDNNILCRYDEAGCEAYTSSAEPKYFKAPGEQICEWRQTAGEGEGGWNWYKKKVKFCDSDGDGLATSSVDTYCLSDTDCDAGISCLLDNHDYECPILPSPFKTIGIGGLGNIVNQPNEDSGHNWTGLCPAAQAGCSEYVDPISKFSSNIIFNADFSQNVDGNTIRDGWDGNRQNIKLESYTLYRLAATGTAATLSCSSGGQFLVLNGVGNNFDNSPVTSIGITDGQSRLIYISGNPDGCEISGVSAVAGNKVELKKAIVSYQLKDKIDNSSCNGQVDFEKGCVLFNGRVYDGSSPASLQWDADLTIDDGQGMAPQVGLPDEQDSNLILKVSPDRTCNKWLACRSYIKDENDNPVCFDIGLCDSVDNNGNCDNFIVPNNPPREQVYSLGLGDEYQNADGYVKAGWSPSSLNNNYYPLNEMKQEGEVAQVPNGSFEIYGSNKYPLGWTPRGMSWEKNLFSVIDNPVAAQTEGVEYPDEGRSYLKYSPSASMVESEFIDVEPNTEYILSADGNTINYHPGSGFDSVNVQLIIETYDSLGLPSHYAAYPTSNSDFISCGSRSQPWYNHCSIQWEAGDKWKNKKVKFRIGGSTHKIKLLFGGAVYFSGLQCCDKVAADGACPNESAGDYYFYPSASCTYRDDINFTKSAAECPAGGSGTYSATVAEDSCAGNAYFDDIKLMPALNNKNNEDIVQTCRLYPENDSLGCSYYEDSGKYKKGWPGYCLEYDRYPGNPDSCLLWYPIDRVKGDGIEEGAGYQGRFPLYYCLENGEAFIPLNFNCGGSDLAPGAFYIKKLTKPYGVFNSAGAADRITVYEGGRNGSQYSLSIKNYLTQKWVGPVANNRGGTHRYWDLGEEQSFRDIKMFDALKITCTSGDGNDGDCDCSQSGGHITTGNGILPVPNCSKLIQTVTPVGQNKYWSGRVYEGSDFSFNCNVSFPVLNKICDYNSDYLPFGSLVPPGDTWNMVSNPYEWDGNPNLGGKQPIYYEWPNTSLEEPYQPRMGQLHSADNIKNLFAQSFKVWQWGSNGVCVGGSNAGGACSSDDCPFGDCNLNINVCSNSNSDMQLCDINNFDCTDCAWAGDDYRCGGIAAGALCCPGGSAAKACSNITVCSGGDNAGLVCSVNQCPGGYCNLGGSGYTEIPGQIWGPPTSLCGLAGRPIFNPVTPLSDYCAILPQVQNIKVNQTGAGNVRVNNTQFVNLTFNSVVDAQQLPLVMYAVDWGDNEKTVVSGVEMRDRANPDNPHSMYHLYSYWDLKAKEASGVSIIDCQDDCAASYGFAGACCAVQPRVKIRDNWGWCNNGVDLDPCPDGGYVPYGTLPLGDWIIVMRN